MQQRISQFALVVKDYDEAIAFYTQKLHFSLVEDTVLSETKRWVRIDPPGDDTCCILLAKAANEHQASRIGDQTGGRVFLFLETDDFWRDYKNLQEQEIRIIRPPAEESYWNSGGVCRSLWKFLGPDRKVDIASEKRDRSSVSFSLLPIHHSLPSLHTQD